LDKKLSKTKAATPPSEYTFDVTRLTEILVQSQGLQSGHWTLDIDFGSGSTKANQPGSKDAYPAALVVIAGVKLVSVDPEDPLIESVTTVDASKLKA